MEWLEQCVRVAGMIAAEAALLVGVYIAWQLRAFRKAVEAIGDSAATPPPGDTSTTTSNDGKGNTKMDDARLTRLIVKEQEFERERRGSRLDDKRELDPDQAVPPDKQALMAKVALWQSWKAWR